MTIRPAQGEENTMQPRSIEKQARTINDAISVLYQALSLLQYARTNNRLLIDRQFAIVEKHVEQAILCTEGLLHNIESEK